MRVLIVLKEIVADIVKLNLPVTAAAAVATVVGAFAPIAPAAPIITGILVAVGVVAEAIKRLYEFNAT